MEKKHKGVEAKYIEKKLKCKSLKGDLKKVSEKHEGETAELEK